MRQKITVLVRSFFLLVVCVTGRNLHWNVAHRNLGFITRENLVVQSLGENDISVGPEACLLVRRDRGLGHLVRSFR